MTATAGTDEFPAPAFDTSEPHSARVYDYLLGGKDNYAADRAAGERLLEAAPEAAASARANRAFLGRAVRYLAGQGIRQFLDIGTGIPTAGNTHQVAQAIASESRVVYVDNDPIVLAHARALLISSAAGATGYIQADLRQPLKVLDAADRLLDLTRPVALLLVAILHFVPDGDNPGGIIAGYRAALVPGSYLVISHGTGQFHSTAAAEAVTKVYARGPSRLALRDKEHIAGFFGDFDLEPPGLVQAPAWRPDIAVGQGDLAGIGVYVGVGRKK